MVDVIFALGNRKKDTTFIVGKRLVDKFCSLTSLKFISFGQRMESQQ